MYSFIDVNEASGRGLPPSEALKLNGAYLEDQIEGYRTLHVAGREALSPELASYETGVRHGSKLQSRRYPARVITVTYQLTAKSNEAFRAAYNQLGRILDTEDAELIFNDEPDKFFTGTPSMLGEIEPGKNALTGEIAFTCLDPFKYSVVEYEARPALDAGSILLDYKGTYKALPTLKADFYRETEIANGAAAALTGKGDCGFVAFFNEDEKIIQLGDPDEADGVNAYEKSQTLLSQAFMSDGAWSTAAQGLWQANNGAALQGDVLLAGMVGMGVASYTVPTNPAATSGMLISVRSDGGQPKFDYKVVAQSAGRTANSVQIRVAITTSLGTWGSYFGNGYGLVASLYIGGTWRRVTLKTTDEYWEGMTGHTANAEFTVTGLGEATASLTGIRFKVERSDSWGGAAGLLSEKACSDLGISTYIASVPETYYLHAAGYGAAGGRWHGPSITRWLPADAAGETGAADFTLTYRQKLCVGETGSGVSQLGGFQAQVAAADGTAVAGVRVLKSQTGKTASLMLFVNGIKVHQAEIDLSYGNPYFGAGAAVQTTTITKSGETVLFNVGGYAKSFTNGAAGVKAAQVSFLFEQYSDASALSYNGLYLVKFVKNNCGTWKDVPNKFSANDAVEADCATGEIRLNGVLSPYLGALGNDWEGFCLTPGLNQIGVAYSGWVPAGYGPAFRVRYREVFL